MMQPAVARSMTDRVLGGVCGGVSAVLGINAWWGRALTVLLTVLSAGVFALVYLMLWWFLPPNLAPDERLTERRLLPLLAVGMVVVLGGVVILGRGLGYFSLAEGDLLWPVVIVVIGLILFLRELRRA